MPLFAILWLMFLLRERLWMLYGYKLLLLISLPEGCVALFSTEKMMILCFRLYLDLSTFSIYFGRHR